MPTENALTQISLGRISITTGNKAQLLQKIERWLQDRLRINSKANTSVLIGFINPHVFNLSFEHETVRTFLNNADITCLDGVGIKLAILLTRRRLLPRVVAEHLFADFLTSLEFPVEAILVGGQPGIPELAAKSMNKLNKNLHIAATIDGYNDFASMSAFIQKHRKTPLVLIGAGSPKSESLALLANEICKSAVIFHIGGGTMNTYADAKKCGPRWVSTIGFEWLHRIIYEPHTRKRYTLGGWVFLKNLLSAQNPRPNKKADLP